MRDRGYGTVAPQSLASFWTHTPLLADQFTVPVTPREEHHGNCPSPYESNVEEDVSKGTETR